MSEDVKSAAHSAEMLGRIVGILSYIVMAALYPVQPDWSVFYLVALGVTAGRACRSAVVWRLERKVDS